MLPKNRQCPIEKWTVFGIAHVIGVHVGDWEGRCSTIVQLILKHNIVAGKYAYGHFRGDISLDSLFGDRATMGFTHHAWIWLPDGRVFDPTRWVFEDVKPYLHVGAAREGGRVVYDEGGTILAESINAQKKPNTKAARKTYPTTGLKAIAEVIASQMGRQSMPGRIDLNWLFWLANQPPHCFMDNDAVFVFYRWLKRRGLLALVPIDFRRMIGFEK